MAMELDPVSVDTGSFECFPVAFEESNPYGICQGNAAERCRFIVQHWMPFRAELDKILHTIEHRVARGFAHGFPLRGRALLALVERNMQLTEQWYGHGHRNMCLVYSWFVQAMEICKVTAYRGKAIPTMISSDGWLRVYDNSVRKAWAAKPPNWDLRSVEHGFAGQKQGESAIDNTVLCNVMQPREARVLLSGYVVRRFFLKLLSLRQRQLLKIVEQATGIALLDQQSDIVLAVLRRLLPGELDQMRIEPLNLSWRCLLDHGTLTTVWGQVPESDQIKITAFITNKLLAGCTQHKHEDEFDKFIQFCKSYPGSFYKDSRTEHLLMLFAGMLIRRVAVVKRSRMATFTFAKYLPLQWTRRVPLCKEKGIQVRASGTSEFSRIRANEAPYAPCHGISIAGGGVREIPISTESAKRVHELLPVSAWTTFNLMHELSPPVDPSARLVNWFLIDIEKICNDARFLNPSLGATIQRALENCPDHAASIAAMILPGDIGCDVGQNPRVSSSIGATQHTQIWPASIAEYPVFQVSRNTDVLIEATIVGGRLHVIRAGLGSKDALFIRVSCVDPTCLGIQEFLAYMRLELLAHYGGVEKVDFLCKAMSDDAGGFVIVLAPQAQLQKRPDSASYINLLTGENQEDHDVFVHPPCLSVNSACGNYALSDALLQQRALAEGELCLRRQYDFVRCPNLWEQVHSLIQRWLHSKDDRELQGGREVGNHDKDLLQASPIPRSMADASAEELGQGTKRLGADEGGSGSPSRRRLCSTTERTTLPSQAVSPTQKP